MRALHVIFYKPDNNDHWINHLVTFFSPPYSHCDLQFENDVATSIYQNEHIYFEKKNFTRNNYERVSLSLTDDEYERVFNYCCKSFENKVQFDLTGMLGCFIPFYSLKPIKKTFCSRYIVEALQQTQQPIFLNMKSMKTSPSLLHDILKSRNKEFLHISGTRLNRIK
jgi:hypothetical protein